MRSTKLLSVLGVVWILCLSLMAKGVVPITITGPVTMCVGNSGTYLISPTAGYHYQWSVTAEGNIPGLSTGSSVGILWGTAGSATVTVNGYDGSNVLQETGTLPVTVQPLPQPTISTSNVGGCQNYADTPKVREQKLPPIPGDPHILDDGSGCPKVCDSSVVTYTAHGPAGSTFGWSVVNGTILSTTATTCTVFWTGPVGFGSITVYDTSIYGCVGSKTVCIELIEKPHARFSVVSPNCVNQSVLFSDLSWANPTSPILNWYWDFGDGGIFTSSSSTPASHTYTTAGAYLVKLVVRNQCGCTDTFKQTIKILSNPGVNIVCIGVQCDSATATYTLSPVPSCPSYHWGVQGGIITAGAGTATITVLWTNVDSSGFGYVTFNPSGCGTPCTAPTVVRVPVITPRGHIYGPKVVCPNSQYLYNMPQWPSTLFTWTVLSSIGATYWPTDQNNQIAVNVHGGPGTIILKCVYENTLLGCGGIAYDTIQVMPPDSILGNTLKCYGSTGTYNMASGASATWTLTYPNHTTTTTTSTSFSTTFGMVGTYTLNAVGNFCLEQPLVINVDTLPPPPDSLIGPDTVCFGTPVNFRTAIASPTSIFAWGISSGSVLLANGNHTTASFTGGSPATIMVWRETMDAAHCHSDTLSKKVYKPNVNVHITGIDTVCPNTPYTYNAGYAGGESYFWQITNNPLLGSVLTNGSVNSSILFNNQPGLAKVAVTVMKCGTPYTDTLNVYILPTPTLVITAPDSVCRDASFGVSISGISGGSVSWNWGDGSLPTPGTPATHIYSTLSSTNFSATIVATVTGVYGCPDTFTANKVIIVKPAPVANITPQGPFYNCSGTFSQPLTATLSAGYGITDSLAWYTPAGVGPTCAPPTCTTISATMLGNYYVVAVGTNGCVDVSNTVQFLHRCPTTCAITPQPTDKIDSAKSKCGSVHLHGIYSATPTAFSWAWNWPTQMLGVSTTSTTLDGTFKLSGLYTFHYTVAFADAFGDTCIVQADTNVLVPLIASMGHLVACSGSNYSVTLADNSNYYPGHNPSSHSWYIDGIYQANTVSASYVATLPPGSHTLAEWVHFDGTDSCMASDFVFLDSMPHANFSFYRDTTCAIDASVKFTNLSTPFSSPWTSFWLFGDGPEGNTQPNPWKVFGTPAGGGYNVTLRVTNEYGCYDDTTRFVPVIPQDLNGTLNGNKFACNGQSVLLTYMPNTGTIYPEWYYWMNASDTMYLNTSSTTNVFSSGSYWVSGYNHYGCLVNTPHKNVTFITPPPANINGDSSQCINVPYTLNGYAGSDPSITYTWIKNTTVVGTTPTYTDPAASVGTFTYQLVISVPDSMGGYCTDTSAPFKVTVHALPSPPMPTYSLINCNTYTFKLNAGGPSYGSYNWSNGMSGMTITVPEAGGPYKVWYTDTFGCTSNNNLFVPRDPRLYLWVFPAGCYGPYCDGWTASHYVLGPVEPFNYWAYMQNPPGTILSSGSGSVGTFTPTSSGDYALILDNGLCRDTSNIMDIQLNAQCAQCQLLRFSLKNIVQTGCEDTMPAFPADTCCHWFITLSFTNTFTSAIGISLSSTNGSMSPGGFSVPPGGSTHTFQFLRNPGFNGGTIVVTMTYIDPTTGRPATCNISVRIPACQQIDPRLADAESSVSNVDGTASMLLAPNPAQDVTRVDYQFAGDPNGSCIEVYDMTGRMVDKQVVTANQGSNYLRLENYRSGIYIVVLRQRGNAILQSRLSVVH